jgi:hypothetical protein
MCGGAPGSVPCPIDVVSWLLVVCLRLLTYSLRNALLAVSHDQVRDLVDYRVVSVLHMTVFGERKRWHLKFQTRCHWHRWHRREVYETHIRAAVRTAWCRHC